ncbi:hypothetical protein N9A45_00605 [bacterium]|nr:hypothetical protein [bacterium]
MLVWALLVSGIGHACWDNILTWLVRNDPDASLIHMLWLRMTVIALFLGLATKAQNVSLQHSWLWWFKFSIIGWVIPCIMYSLSVIWTGYRVSVSFQPFIPLLVALRIGAPMNTKRCLALTCCMCGTLFIWSGVSWKQDLWMVWIALLASIVQVVCLTEWFVMIGRLEREPLAHISRGTFLGVGLMFLATIIWNPQHVAAAYVYKADAWLAIVAAGGISAACKYWLIARFALTMSADTVAVFECIHPIATLAGDIVRAHDIFEWQDAVAITLYACGWILYPKENI